MTAIADILFDVETPTLAVHSDTAVNILRGLPKQLKFSIAACAAVGLTYWADHPGAANKGRYVWALDSERTAHIVHVCGGATNHGTAEHMCARAARRKDGKKRIWRAWSEAGFINDHGARQYTGYDVVEGIKDSFRGTHVPECEGTDIRTTLPRDHVKSFDV